MWGQFPPDSSSLEQPPRPWQMAATAVLFQGRTSCGCGVRGGGGRSFVLSRERRLRALGGRLLSEAVAVLEIPTLKLALGLQSLTSPLSPHWDELFLDRKGKRSPCLQGTQVHRDPPPPEGWVREHRGRSRPRYQPSSSGKCAKWLPSRTDRPQPLPFSLHSRSLGSPCQGPPTDSESPQTSASVVGCTAGSAHNCPAVPLLLPA